MLREYFKTGKWVIDIASVVYSQASTQLSENTNTNTNTEIQIMYRGVHLTSDSFYYLLVYLKSKQSSYLFIYLFCR